MRSDDFGHAAPPLERPWILLGETEHTERRQVDPEQHEVLLQQDRTADMFELPTGGAE